MGRPPMDRCRWAGANRNHPTASAIVSQTRRLTPYSGGMIRVFARRYQGFVPVTDQEFSLTQVARISVRPAPASNASASPRV